MIPLDTNAFPSNSHSKLLSKTITPNTHTLQPITVHKKKQPPSSMAATMAMLNFKCFTSNSLNHLSSSKPIPPTKPTSPLLSLPYLPKGLISISKSENLQTQLSKSAVAGAVFAALSSCDSAIAAQQIADLAAEGDNRGLALLLPIIPAILWVLYNILQPALNQVNRMRSEKAVVVGLGLGAYSLFATENASAGEIAQMADASSDSRGLLLLFVIAPAVLWVLYNILQPALNQINRMKSE